ncbi:hypothetical protein FD754_021403 [Muntiacus muntjak]|uniref:Taste receptor type 2 member 5 n=1 Tax=Muntiacus muntjak TaxID=9888 RepID=A0A5N3V5M5_MUNMU|nr:hypothetical protein FD754_021403 [Muntiacus muntjak]
MLSVVSPSGNLQCSQELYTPICTKAEHLLRQQRETSPAVPTSILGLLMLVAVSEFLIGLVGNGVFVVWSFREWLRTFRESLYNLIVLSLAVCWLLLQWLIVVDLSLFLLFQSSHWLRYLSVFRVLVSQASLWFASFLSVCYCRKILTVNIHYPSLHSVILIMGNPRMKQTCERILWKTVCA